MKILTFLILSSLLLFSCDDLRQEVVLDGLTDQPFQLAVACFISPQDTVLAARVTRSRPLFDTTRVTSVNIGNANVILSQGTRQITLIYQGRLGYYRAKPADFPIRAGETYTLRIKTPDGKQVESICTVPGPVTLQRVAFDSSRDEAGRRDRFFVQYYWQDPTGQSNYYETRGTFSFLTNAQGSKESSVPIDFKTTTTQRALVSDKNGNGSVLISRQGLLGNELPVIPGKNSFKEAYRSAVVTAELLHVDENYYRYHEAIERYRQSDGNPFAEPVLIPSNIQNGLGCFGAYNLARVRQQLK